MPHIYTVINIRSAPIINLSSAAAPARRRNEDRQYLVYNAAAHLERTPNNTSFVLRRFFKFSLFGDVGF